MREHQMPSISIHDRVVEIEYTVRRRLPRVVIHVIQAEDGYETFAILIFDVVYQTLLPPGAPENSQFKSVDRNIPRTKIIDITPHSIPRLESQNGLIVF